MTISRRHVLMLIGVAALSAAVTVQSVSAQQHGKKQYAFKGTVERVDQHAKTLTVGNEEIPGWMMAMTMTYGVDKPAVLAQIKAGDQITATVYEGDTKTLYDVKVVTSNKKK